MKDVLELTFHVFAEWLVSKLANVFYGRPNTPIPHGRVAFIRILTVFVLAYDYFVLAVMSGLIKGEQFSALLSIPNGLLAIVVTFFTVLITIEGEHRTAQTAVFWGILLAGIGCVSWWLWILFG